MQGGDNMKSVFAGNKAKFAYFSFIFIIISTAMYTFYAKEPHWWYIVWNDILAVIPLFAAMLCEHYFSKKKAVPAVIFGKNNNHKNPNITAGTAFFLLK